MEYNQSGKKTQPGLPAIGVKPQPATVVVGAGLAGLACAIMLQQAGHNITIIEATSNSGGRARTIRFGDSLVDNGQHILIGAYSETLKLIELLKISASTVLTKMPLCLRLINSQDNMTLSLPNIASPLHLLGGLYCAKGLTCSEKLSITRLFVKLYRINFSLPEDMTVLSALQQLSQQKSLLEKFWQPIALAALSTPIAIASANVFFRVLQDTFTGKASNANWLFPCQDLGKLLPEPALNFLIANNAAIIFDQAITSLSYQGNRCIDVVSKTKRKWQADNIVLATPAWMSAKLLATSSSNAPLAADLTALEYTMITTIYFLFAQPIALEYPLLGLLDGPLQWLFDRRIAAQPHILSAIITGNDQNQWTHATLQQAAIKQLARHLPNMPKIIDIKIIREQKAAFSCTPQAQKLRPQNTTNIKNLFLAGDYTHSNYPATIEGAIRSGIACATAVLRQD